MYFRTMTVVFIAVLGLILPGGTSAGEVDCLKCHAKLKKEKTVHAALEMGCATCHTAIDAAVLPHKKTGTIAKGLSADQPDLCYGCHDKGLFTKKNVHAAVGMGCTGCHNPHSSKNAKLLTKDVPGLCFGCHDKAAFEKKTVHPPVAGGMCLGCHNPHSSDETALLLKRPYELCIDCHGDIPKKGHVISLHPLGELKTVKKGDKIETIETPDPLRPGKRFYCGSCHDPHSANIKQLLRFRVKTTMDLCVNCHKM